MPAVEHVGPQFNHDFSGLNPERHSASDINVADANVFMSENKGRTRYGSLALTENNTNSRVYEHSMGRRDSAFGLQSGSDVRWYSSRTSMTEREYARRKAAP